MDSSSELSGIDDDVNSFMRTLRLQTTTTGISKDLKEQINKNHFYWSNEESQKLAQIKSKIYKETKQTLLNYELIQFIMQYFPHKTQHQIKKNWNKIKITSLQ